MNINELQKLVSGLPGFQSRERKPHKFWVPYAWAVRVLVDNGESISGACKKVLRTADVPMTEEHVACLRVVYYKIRRRDWPAGLEEVVMDGSGDLGVPEGEQPEPEVVVSAVDNTEREQPAPEYGIPMEPEAGWGSIVIDPTEEADDGYVPDQKEEFEV
jgi:hypothetical protein